MPATRMVEGCKFNYYYSYRTVHTRADGDRREPPPPLYLLLPILVQIFASATFDRTTTEHRAWVPHGPYSMYLSWS